MTVDVVLECAAGHKWRVEIDGAVVSKEGPLGFEFPSGDLELCAECGGRWVRAVGAVG